MVWNYELPQYARRYSLCKIGVISRRVMERYMEYQNPYSIAAGVIVDCKRRSLYSCSVTERKYRIAPLVFCQCRPRYFSDSTCGIIRLYSVTVAYVFLRFANMIGCDFVVLVWILHILSHSLISVSWVWSRWGAAYGSSWNNFL